MPSMTVSFPDAITHYIEDQVATGGYSNPSGYLRELVRADQKRHAKAMLEQTLAAALSEGDPIEASDEWWASLRNSLGRRSSGG